MFGAAPVYVCDPKLQDGKKLPKWAPHTHHGQFLGISPDHSSTVGYILNLITSHISPQCHIIHNDLFNLQCTQCWDWWTSGQDLVSTGLDHLNDTLFENPTELPPPSLCEDWLTPH